VVEAVASSLRERWHNPSSTHRAGQQARAAIELARRDVADLLGVRARELTFTGSGTESIDLALRGVVGAWRARNEQSRTAPVRLVTTRVEHAAVRDLATELEQTNAATAQFAPVGSDGVVDLAALSALLHDPDWSLTVVSVQWANNETGVVQPIEAIRDCCAEHGAIFHCDAVQWIGKMSMDDARDLHAPDRADAMPAHRHAGPGAPPCDLMSFSPHKFHGLKGVGGLWIRPGVKIRPTIAGTQELGRRGGTENVPGIVGAGVAASQACEWLADEASRRSLRMLRDRFERMVLEACPGSVVNAGSSPRLWNTSNIAFPRLEAEAILLALSERGVCASAGAACSSGSLDPSPVLLAMGIPEPVAHGSIRFSLSRFTTREELDESVRLIAQVIAKLRETLPV
jgi:cysteine desulfurase